MAILDENYFDLAVLIFASILTGLAAGPVGIWIARRLDIIDYPGRTAHQIHQKPTPRAGGIALALAMLVMFLVNRLWVYPEIIQIILPAIIVFTFGLWDDKFGMNAPVKLIGQLVAVTMLILLGVRVQFLENPQFFFRLNDSVAFGLNILITYLWMVGITNATNMVDSMDGLAVGLCQIISAFFIVLAMISGQPFLVILSAILFGVTWGIGFFNRQPAKTFLGDSGAQTLGFVLAAAALIYHPRSPSQASSWFAPILFFSVPIFDTTLVTISRALKKQPFYKANLDHTYHRLVEKGWDASRAVGALHLAGMFGGLLATCAMYLDPLYANAIFAFWAFVFASFIFYFIKSEKTS